MPRGGRRPGAGRPKGTNKERQDEIAGLIAKAARVKDGRAWVIGQLVKHAPRDPGSARYLADQIIGRPTVPVAVESDPDRPLVVEIIRKEMNGGGGTGTGSQRDRADVPPRSTGASRHRAR